MSKGNFEWFKLDNAAKIFPGQNSDGWSNVFRIGVQLRQGGQLSALAEGKFPVGHEQGAQKTCQQRPGGQSGE